MQFEDASPDNLPLLETGLRALAHDLGDPFRLTPDALHGALFGAPPTCRGLVATEGSELRGVALYGTLMSTSLGGHGAFVSDLWVGPGTRGRGLGRHLLAEITRRSKARFVRLAVYDDSPRARAFYDRLGFAAKPGETILYLSGPALDALEDTR